MQRYISLGQIPMLHSCNMCRCHVVVAFPCMSRDSCPGGLFPPTLLGLLEVVMAVPAVDHPV